MRFKCSCWFVNPQQALFKEKKMFSSFMDLQHVKITSLLLSDQYVLTWQSWTYFSLSCFRTVCTLLSTDYVLNICLQQLNLQITTCNLLFCFGCHSQMITNSFGSLRHDISKPNYMHFI